MRATRVVIGLLASGCITAPSRHAGAIDTSPRTRVVRSDELASLPDMPADEAIARLRPELLRPDFRGEVVEIVIDDRPASMAALHALSASAIAEVRLLSAAEASLEFGVFHARPILRITLCHGTARE